MGLQPGRAAVAEWAGPAPVRCGGTVLMATPVVDDSTRCSGGGAGRRRPRVPATRPWRRAGCRPDPPAAVVPDRAFVPNDGVVADDLSTIELRRSELRAVAAYAAACARPALGVFERERPDDRRPQVAIDAAQAFADDGRRTKAMRGCAWAAHRAAQEARDAGQVAAGDAARAAGHAAGAAFLHPLAKATRVLHILGSAAHAARALELSAGDDPDVGAHHIARARDLAHPVVLDVLRRYPAAPGGGGRVGELIRQLDASLR